MIQQEQSLDLKHRQATRILFVKNSERDIKPLTSALEKAGYTHPVVSVDTPALLEREVGTGDYEVVISDYNLRGWTAIDALKIVKSSGREIPVVVVSKSFGDEVAAHCIKQGAADYVPQGRMARLPSAIQSASEEKMRRQKKSLAEEDLRASERQYRLLFEDNPNPMWVFEVETRRFLAVNRAAIEHYGYSIDEFLSMTLEDIRPPEEVPRFMVGITGAALAQTVDRGVWRHKKKSGMLIDVEITARAISFRNCKAELVLAHDITARLNSELQYRSIIDGAPFGIYRVTQTGQVLMANPALVKMLGYETEEEALHLNSILDIYADPAERQRNMESFRSGGAAACVEAVWKQKNGKPLFVSLHGRSVCMPKDNSVVEEIFVENITDKRSLEARYRQAQKMEAIGNLAGGVAHDFNNLLGIITGYSDLLLEQHRGDPLTLRKLGAIRKAAESAVRLTRQLLAFSRKQILEPKLLDLGSLVRETSSMLLRLLGDDIELSTSAAPGLGTVKADPTQIEQVIINLAVNARDAMPHGGKLIMETANVELDEPCGPQHVQVSGRYVMLTVSDTGFGMSEEIQRQIFEPFFTTKEKDHGTGLGLATVYGIVKQSGGYIWVYSEVGKGTTFKVYFPRTDGIFDVAENEAKPIIPRGSETVFLVEDAVSLRELNSEVLHSLGYTVLGSGSGAQALRLAEQHPLPIHILITDVVMPGMNGRELADNLKTTHPETKVLFVSGYPDSTIAAHGVLNPGVAFLQKPFTRASLARKVREVLSA